MRLWIRYHNIRRLIERDTGFGRKDGFFFYEILNFSYKRRSIKPWRPKWPNNARTDRNIKKRTNGFLRELLWYFLDSPAVSRKVDFCYYRSDICRIYNQKKFKRPRQVSPACDDSRCRQDRYKRAFRFVRWIILGRPYYSKRLIFYFISESRLQRLYFSSRLITIRSHATRVISLTWVGIPNRIIKFCYYYYYYYNHLYRYFLFRVRKL